MTNTIRTAGFTLVEVVLAVGVAGFCLLPISGLLLVALGSNQAGIEQTSANGVLSAVMSDLQATPSTSGTVAATSSQYSIIIPAAMSTGTSETLYFNGEHQLVATAALGTYRVTLNFDATPSSGGGARSATELSVKVSWPAPVNPATTTPNGFVQAFAALDRN